MSATDSVSAQFPPRAQVLAFNAGVTWDQLRPVLSREIDFESRWLSEIHSMSASAYELMKLPGVSTIQVSTSPR